MHIKIQALIRSSPSSNGIWSGEKGRGSILLSRPNNVSGDGKKMADKGVGYYNNNGFMHEHMLMGTPLSFVRVHQCDGFLCFQIIPFE